MAVRYRFARSFLPVAGLGARPRGLNVVDNPASEAGFALVLTLVVILALSLITEAMTRWVSAAQYNINMHEPARPSYYYMLSGYYRNLSSRSMWRPRRSVGG